MSTQRLATLPAEVRLLIEDRSGLVVKAENAAGGLNSEIAARVRTEKETMFVKGLRREHRRVWTQQREADINPHVRGIAPGVLWHVQDNGWDLLVFEDIDGRHGGVPGGRAGRRGRRPRMSCGRRGRSPAPVAPAYPVAPAKSAGGGRFESSPVSGGPQPERVSGMLAGVWRDKVRAERRCPVSGPAVAAGRGGEVCRRAIIRICGPWTPGATGRNRRPPTGPPCCRSGSRHRRIEHDVTRGDAVSEADAGAAVPCRERRSGCQAGT